MITTVRKRAGSWLALAGRLLPAWLALAALLGPPGNAFASSTDTVTLTVSVIQDAGLPAPISYLSAFTGSAEGEIRLSWTSPGEDGTVGALTGLFRIKMSSAHVIGSGDFNTPAASLAVRTVDVSTSALAPLTQVNYTVTGLLPGRQWNFAVKARDSGSNFSIWNSSLDVATVNTVASTMSQTDVTPPSQVNNISALAGGVFYTSMTLTWTAPGDDGTLASGFDNNGRSDSYTLKFATFTFTAAEFDALPVPSSFTRLVAATTSYGNNETYILTGLEGATSYYFALKAYDEVPSSSTMSNLNVQRTLDDVAPGPVTLLAASNLAAGLRLDLAWVNPVDSDFAGVRINYRTDGAAPVTSTDGVNVANLGTGVTTFAHTGLSYGVTYYYTVFAVDAGGNYSVGTSTQGSPNAQTETVAPDPVPAIRAALSANGNSITISWKQVTRNEDGSLIGDLAGYRVYRSSGLTINTSHFLMCSSAPASAIFGGNPAALSFMDSTVGGPYTYWVTAYDSNGNESVPMLVQSDLNVVAIPRGDARTNLAVPKTMTPMLYLDTNNLGYDVTIKMTRNNTDESGRTLRSFSVAAYRADTGTWLTQFAFTKREPKISLSYEVGSDGMLLAPGLFEAVKIHSADAATQLAVFWFNGIEWVKLGGTVDTSNKTVTVNTKLLGKYQLRQSFRSTSFTLSNVFPRIFTPNGDGLNDSCNFVFENPQDTAVSGKVYDLNSCLVADMRRGPSDNWLVWDGKDASGKEVPSGVYIYQLEGQGTVVNGSVVIAK